MSDSNEEGDLPKYTPELLRQIRKQELGFANMEDFADRIGWSRSTVQRYESGTLPMNPEFISALEQLRATIRAERVRAANARRLDLTGLSPGLALVEFVPTVRELVGKLFQVFVAVPKAMLPAGAGHGPSAPPKIGASPSEHDARPALGLKDRRMHPLLWLIAAGVAGTAILSILSLGVLLAIHGYLQGGQRSARVLRVARDAKMERPATPPAASQEQNVPETTGTQEPDYVPDEFFTDDSSEGSEGATPKLKRLKMPKKPYSWQKVAPCGQGEHEQVGGCWLILKNPPPCSDMAVESDNQCFVPVRAKPPKPNSVAPKK